jgi:hypothetical protein
MPEGKHAFGGEGCEKSMFHSHVLGREFHVTAQNIPTGSRKQREQGLGAAHCCLFTGDVFTGPSVTVIASALSTNVGPFGGAQGSFARAGKTAAGDLPNRPSNDDPGTMRLADALMWADVMPWSPSCTGSIFLSPW